MMNGQHTREWGLSTQASLSPQNRKSNIIPGEEQVRVKGDKDRVFEELDGNSSGSRIKRRPV